MKLKKFPYKAGTASKATAAGVAAIEAGKVKAAGRLSLGAKAIKKIRLDMGLTQRAFAQILQVELSAVESWEQGRRVPDRPVTALILMVAKHPETRGWLKALTGRARQVQSA
jgi:DNA-binding transcriptional regulator YiaG